MSKTLRLNVNYIILFKIPKNQLSQIAKNSDFVEFFARALLGYCVVIQYIV